MPAVESIKPGHRISLDLPPKRQHVVSLRAEFDVMDVYEPFNSARLMRTLKMTGKLRAHLLDFNVFGGTPGLVDVLRVDRPISRRVIRRRVRWRLLRSGVSKVCREAKLHVRLHQKILRPLSVTAQMVTVRLLSHVNSLVGIDDIALCRGQIAMPVWINVHHRSLRFLRTQYSNADDGGKYQGTR